MPRTPEAIILEAEEWAAVTTACLELNTALGAIGDLASSAAVDAVMAATRGDLAGAVAAQGDALTSSLEQVVAAQGPLLALIKLAGDRITTLRVEAAERRAELEQ